MESAVTCLRKIVVASVIVVWCILAMNERRVVFGGFTKHVRRLNRDLCDGTGVEMNILACRSDRKDTGDSGGRS